MKFQIQDAEMTFGDSAVLISLAKLHRRDETKKSWPCEI